MHRFSTLLFAATLMASSLIAKDQAAYHFDVKVHGAGAGKPAMVLIPGLSSDGAVWDAVVEHYSSQYECHVVTLPGFSKQPALSDKTNFLATVRDEISAYARTQKLKAPVIAGHSLGGFVALWIAETTPTLPSKVIIVDSVPFLPALWNDDATPESTKDQANSMKLMMAGLKGDAWKTYQRSNPALKAMISKPEDIARATQWGIDSDAETVSEAFYEMMQIDLRPGLKNVTVPVLVMAALKGTPEGSVKKYEAQYAGLPSAKVVPFPDSLHFIMYDDLPHFLQATDSFLKTK